MESYRKALAQGYFLYAFFRGLNFNVEADIRHSLREYNMPFSSFRTLWILYFDPNITMSTLTTLSQTNISNVFRQLTKLEENGFVIIKRGKDARTKEITLTEAGKKLVKMFIDEHSEHTNIKLISLIKKLPTEDLAKFMEVISWLGKELIEDPYAKLVTDSSDRIYHKST